MTTVLIDNQAAPQRAALHRTELLLARCRDCRPPAAPMAPAQANWHARRQENFLAWLDAGGFAQALPERPQSARHPLHCPDADPDPAADGADHDRQLLRPIENSGIAPLFSVP
nr:hypothetical protein [uncultured Duganella sp.]